ncbi:MAG: cyanophycinase [Idiomarina sp.]|nr:cyanophycinase [Idiomarina sp.]
MKNRYACLTLLPFLGLLACHPAQAEPAEPTAYNLMLAGGSINLCSSMSLRHCKTDAWLDADMRQGNYLYLSEERMNTLPQALEMYEFDRDIDAIMKHLAAIVAENEGKRVISGRRFSTLFHELREDPDDYLSDRNWYLLTDYLELPQDATEVVNFAQAAVPYGNDIMTSFVQMAQQARSQREEPDTNSQEPPLILVVTASARDSYEAINFYQGAFAEAGAKAQWLPVDAPMHHAMQAGSCDQLANFQAKVSRAFDRQRVYPEFWQTQIDTCQNPQSIEALIAQADGIFINGGDQSLTRQAFITEQGEPAAWLTQIQQRLQAGTLAVGGTSAGSAVQPSAAMISNGASHMAIGQRAQDVPPPDRDCGMLNNCGKELRPHSLTYQSAGGLGVYPFGLVDTHFSERQRQARIIALGADTNTAQATGVDETTALIIHTQSGAFEIIGRHGVFFARDMQRRSFWTRAVDATITYALSGSRGVLSDDGLDKLEFSDTPRERAPFYRNELSSGIYFVEGLDAWCAGGAERFQKSYEKTRLKPTEDTRKLAHAHGCQVENLPVSFSL